LWSSRTHGRRDTSAYPPTPNTTGIITNIPNTVLIIDLSIRLVSVALWRRLLVELQRYAAIRVQQRRWQADTAVTIVHRAIFRARSVYAEWPYI
jgi:hypothetical protein